MSLQLINTTNAPNQTLQVSLNVNNAILKLNITLRFNEMAQYWVLGILDQNNNMLVDSIPLLTGTWPAANILQQCQYLGIGSAYIINLGTAVADYPGVNDLGSNFLLIWGDNTNSLA
jgi:hypothetical protein